MITGAADLMVTESTLVVALQEYLNKRTAVGYAPRVTSVKLCTTNNSSVRRFEIGLAEPSPEMDKTAGVTQIAHISGGGGGGTLG